MANNKTKKLIDDVTKKINSSEYRTVTMKGIKNLSRSDLETAIMYAENFDGNRFNGLMNPLGNVKELLDAYGVKAENNYSW